MGTQLPLPKNGTSPQFSAHICDPKMDGWIKMSLRREVGLIPSDVALDGDPAPLPKKGGRAPPHFQPISIVAKRPDGSRCHLYGGKPRPRPHCARRGPSPPSPQKRGHSIYPVRMSYCHYVTVIQSHDQKDAINNYLHFPQRGTAPQFLADVYCGQTVTHLSCC